MIISIQSFFFHFAQIIFLTIILFVYRNYVMILYYISFLSVLLTVFSHKNENKHIYNTLYYTIRENDRNLA